jgi:hypothetical protein
MHDDLDLNTLTNLIAIGYVVTDGPFNGIAAPGAQKNRQGRPTTASSRSHDRLRHMDGRLDNLAYMARAIDELDGVAYAGPKRADEASGRRQIHHLLEGSIPEMRAGGLLYVALRRLQRAGNLVALRVGLTILLAHDHGEISGHDALAAVWPGALREGDEDVAILDARMGALSGTLSLPSAA